MSLFTSLRSQVFSQTWFPFSSISYICIKLSKTKINNEHNEQLEKSSVSQSHHHFVENTGNRWETVNMYFNILFGMVSREIDLGVHTVGMKLFTSLSAWVGGLGRREVETRSFQGHRPSLASVGSPSSACR